MANEYYLDEIEDNIMNELKDFQGATVKRINQIFTEEHKNRVLVSDEVGLGKTLVAKGVIAKYANYKYKHGDDLFKVVYICSNSTIVDQNLKKLKIVSEIKPKKGDTSRLSMQHLNIYSQYNDELLFKNKDNSLGMNIQLIPLTPKTSFYKNSKGTMDERALMFAILHEFPTLNEYSNELSRIFYGIKSKKEDKDKSRKNWEEAKRTWMGEVNYCNIKSNKKYLEDMVKELLFNVNHSKCISDLENLCQRIREKKKVSEKDIEEQIVKFREVFADISLEMFDPDLIILDEFQRFKPILNSDEGSDMYKLAKKLFDPKRDVKILMLSATPYKMYSALDEMSKDEMGAHYSEFLDLMKFLKDPENENGEFREVWDDYSIQLKELCKNKSTIICAKSKAENQLFNNVCRTERLSESNLADIIDDAEAENSLSVLEEDILSYVNAQNMLNDVNIPLDYIKSTPYIMSYMDGYEFKKNIKEHFKKHIDEIGDLDIDTLWLNKSNIDNYYKISPNNARLNDLMKHVFKNNASNLLWVPPSMPYYELGGVFKDNDDYSKTLVFSSWDMVPKMISTMLSYEFERQTIGQMENPVNYFYPRDQLGFGTNPYPRMNFSIRNEPVSKISLFALIYPSISLVDAYNPLEYFNRKLTLDEIEKEVKNNIKQKLEKIECNDNDNEDPKWYYLAPLLLDSEFHVNSDFYVDLWFDQFNNLTNDYPDYFKTSFKTLKDDYDDLISKKSVLGAKPEGLIDVLCDIAIASPAICAYRSYVNELPSNDLIYSHLDAPSEIGIKFINLMNHSESTAVIDLNFKPDLRHHWKNVLKYSKDGNLQAVFDEYVHLLSNDVFEKGETRLLSIHEGFLSAFEFNTTYNNEIDTFDAFKAEMETGKSKKVDLRTHFAASFAKGKSDKNSSNRKETVINAFNSPFRPFVVTSTSSGQEGLDFHKYCRKIVHWNLPSNPIDLEQREGRINRFECLVIRQNVAKRYGDAIRKLDKNSEKNIWKRLFDIAYEKENNNKCSDLIPHWGLTETKDMVKIERIVPMYPFSNDEIKYDRLIKILSAYRLTLGQPGQEKLLDSIFEGCPLNEINIEDLFINLSPYFKKDVADLERDC